MPDEIYFTKDMQKYCLYYELLSKLGINFSLLFPYKFSFYIFLMKRAKKATSKRRKKQRAKIVVFSR